MSMYDMVYGKDKYAMLAVAALYQAEEFSEDEETQIDFGRFRDAFFEKTDDKYYVRVHTRNGGNNREDYEVAIESLRKHSFYVRDEDCPHDSTYADFIFELPQRLVDDIAEEVSDDDFWKEPIDHVARMEEALGAIRGRGK